MAREGTRSATGNSKPRVFETVDTAPAIKRITKSKVAKKPAAESTAVASKPAGVTKKAPAKKNGVAAKVSRNSAFPCRHVLSHSLCYLLRSVWLLYFPGLRIARDISGCDAKADLRIMPDNTPHPAPLLHPMLPMVL